MRILVKPSINPLRIYVLFEGVSCVHDVLLFNVAA